MPGGRARESIRFADFAASHPAAAVLRWKALSGWRAVACPARFPAPEILHAVEILPVTIDGASPQALLAACDRRIVRSSGGAITMAEDTGASFVLSDPFPAQAEAALDLLEAFAEWAAAVSGRPCTGGALARSLRGYLRRESAATEVERRCAEDPAFLAPAARGVLRRAADVLPVETHASLLERVIGAAAGPEAPAGIDGDPLLYLARRAAAARTVG
jgi:hypothetical protein